MSCEVLNLLHEIFFSPFAFYTLEIKKNNNRISSRAWIKKNSRERYLPIVLILSNFHRIVVLEKNVDCCTRNKEYH